MWLWTVKDFSRLRQNVRYAETYFAARGGDLRETSCQRACGNSGCGTAPASPLAFRAGQQLKARRRLAEQFREDFWNFKDRAIIDSRCVCAELGEPPGLQKLFDTSGDFRKIV